MYLLSMKGENVQEDQKIENPEFLMEIMEINEEVRIYFTVSLGYN